MQFRDRASGALVQTLPLSGTSFANITSECIIWTGQAGYEIGLLNYVTKTVLLFSRASGAFTGQSVLPASAVTHAQFRFCYTNNRVWLFNASLRKWNAYCIWSGMLGCPTWVLPVELLDFSASCDHGVAAIRWSTASETNSSHFEIQRSNDAYDWKFVGRIPAAGNSQQPIEYAWRDAEPLPSAIAYYRLRQVDLNGDEEVFQHQAVQRCDNAMAKAVVFPNPGHNNFTVRLLGPIPSEIMQVRVIDAAGRATSERTYTVVEQGADLVLDLGALGAGAYLITIADAAGQVFHREQVIKE